MEEQHKLSSGGIKKDLNYRILMYSREESKKLRQEFWIEFGKDYPQKWVLYNTKIKDFSLKFDFTRKYAEVSLEIASKDEVIRQYYYEKLESLKSIISEEYLPRILSRENYQLDNGKIISKIFLRKEGLNIHNKNDWKEAQKFLSEKMTALESFFLEYRDFIEQ